MKISIGAGHFPPDFGCINQKEELAEYIECLKIVSFCNDSLWIEGFKIFNFFGSLRQKVKMINKSKSDIAIEIHLNWANNENARGGLIMYYPSEKSKKLAEFLIKAMRNMTTLPVRGIFEGRFRLDKTKPYLYILRKTRCPTIVLEPLFLSNYTDVQLLKSGMIHKILAGTIYLGVLDYVKTFY